MILKKILFTVAVSTLALSALPAYADGPCKKREAAIEAQLAEAKASNLPVAGLEEAIMAKPCPAKLDQNPAKLDTFSKIF